MVTTAAVAFEFTVHALGVPVGLLQASPTAITTPELPSRKNMRIEVTRDSVDRLTRAFCSKRPHGHKRGVRSFTLGYSERPAVATPISAAFNCRNARLGVARAARALVKVWCARDTIPAITPLSASNCTASPRHGSHPRDADVAACIAILPTCRAPRLDVGRLTCGRSPTPQPTPILGPRPIVARARWP